MLITYFLVLTGALRYWKSTKNCVRTNLLNKLSLNCRSNNWKIKVMKIIICHQASSRITIYQLAISLLFHRNIHIVEMQTCETIPFHLLSTLRSNCVDWICFCISPAFSVRTSNRQVYNSQNSLILLVSAVNTFIGKNEPSLNHILTVYQKISTL